MSFKKLATQLRSAAAGSVSDSDAMCLTYNDKMASPIKFVPWSFATALKYLLGSPRHAVVLRGSSVLKGFEDKAAVFCGESGPSNNYYVSTYPMEDPMNDTHGGEWSAREALQEACKLTAMSINT